MYGGREKLHVLQYLPYLGGQKKFGDERPFTHEGNYLVLACCLAVKLTNKIVTLAG